MTNPEFSSIHDLRTVQAYPAGTRTSVMQHMTSAISSHFFAPFANAIRRSKFCPGFALEVVGVPPCCSQLGIWVSRNFADFLKPPSVITGTTQRKVPQFIGDGDGSRRYPQDCSC